MFSFTGQVDLYREQGFDDMEIDSMISMDMAEGVRRFVEGYYDDPIVQDGWHQQDVIDMYRRER